MPNTIITQVRAKRDSMKLPGHEGERIELRDKSVEAIKGGIESDAWRDYMLQFVDPDPNLGGAQLRRLLATDNTSNDTTLNMRRAYMLANAVCGPFSPNMADIADFDFTVESIDAGLPMDCVAVAPLMPQ